MLVTVGAACRTAAPPAAPLPPAAAPPPPVPLAMPGETHLRDVRQLTFGGENAEAYWSPNGAELIFQAHGKAQGPAAGQGSGQAPGCDRIYRLPITLPDPKPIPVSNGEGATTCGFFLPGTKDVIFSSTQLAGPACPPPPDRSNGYVWAIYPSYDIFRAGADGKNLRRLTDTPGYDAEATACPADGSLVFTSMRDGDLEIYRMDADGKNVRRLTHEVGYDGGAVFDADCTHIAWRASRPKAGPERDEYQRMLQQGLVRPTKLELWMANADGSDAHQVTYLDAASFAPAFFPVASHTAERRIIFSSNYGDPQGREFDLWAIDASGANLERITTAPGFDGFPMFSPASDHLAFASNRATAPGQHDTNVFVARWDQKVVRRYAETGADRVLGDVRWLADPEREGRGVGTAGLLAAGTYMEAGLQRAGLKAAAGNGSFRQPFPVPTAIQVAPGTTLVIGGVVLPATAFTPAAYSAPGSVKASLVLAGHGIVDPALGVNDYAGVDARGKIVVVRRFAPDTAAFSAAEARSRAGDVRRKAFTAREKGAKALLVVDAPLPPPGQAPPGWNPPEEAPLPALRAEGYGDAGIPVLFVHRGAFAKALARLTQRQPVTANVNVALKREETAAFNVVARVPAGVPEGERLPGVVLLGAHYDHLGLGGRHSMEPDSHLAHPGADDNASGAAALIEAARQLSAERARLRRDVIVVAFSGEEEGDLGSTHFTRTPPPGLAMRDVTAMVNLDMVGRLRDNRAAVLGTASADEWLGLVSAACAGARIECSGGGAPTDGFGASDQMPFAAAGVPVVHFFTGTHHDYHRPSDTADKINAAGAAQVALAAAALVASVANRPEPLKAKHVDATPPGSGDMRSFGASLGTIPDYAGPPNGAPGVLLAGVRPGGPAEVAGLRRGDILLKLGAHQVRTVEDFMYALNESRPGETVTAIVLRDGKQVPIKVTFQQGRH